MSNPLQLPQRLLGAPRRGLGAGPDHGR